MDPRETFGDLGEVIRTAVDNGLANTWTALPCKVLEDSNGFVVKAQSTIQLKQFDRESGQSKDLDMPPMPNLPVQFASGGGFVLTHPIKAGDEGIIIFASRCIDGWWDQGGERPQPQLWQRRHSPADGMFIPGVRSKPRRLGGPEGNGQARNGEQTSKPPSTTSFQIRSEDGQFYIELGPEGAVTIVAKTLTIQASEKVRIETPVVEVTGDVVAGQGDGAVSLLHHVHDNVEPGDGRSGEPVKG